jgi:beta-galactosidase
MRTYADDPIVFTLEGPAKLIGDNPFSLIGGTGAVWVRAGETPGQVKLTAKHPRLGTQTVLFTLQPAPAEAI